METQKTPDSQSNLEKEKRSWRNQAPGLQTKLQSYSNQDNMVLAQKQKYRSMEQDRNPRDKPTYINPGSVVVAHGLSCSAACGIFPDHGSNPCPCISRQILNH